MLYGAVILLVIITLIPFIRHDFWIFRVFEYPRVQKLVLLASCTVAALLIDFPDTAWKWSVTAAALINLIYLFYLIFPFTIFGRKQIVGTKKPDKNNIIKILIANVYQDNDQYDAYHRLFGAQQPDIILMVETDKRWESNMNDLHKHYPFSVRVPLENTYGMLLFSKLPLEDFSVNYLVEPDIPSIETVVVLPSGQRLRLFCLHPTPPVPQENPRSTERDKEILLVAKKAKQMKEPVIVMGDLNDVAWSYTTELFGKESGLLDPRRGRGFFNSFNARWFFLRFPLDHIFCSRSFSLTALRRMPACGSDHFPMLATLQYEPEVAAENAAPAPDASDREKVDEKINAPTSG